jgi:CARDB protein
MTNVRIVALAAAAAALSVHVLQAQQGGANISVLPALTDPPDILKSDQVAQKQVEGSFAFSTRNFLHGMAAFIDFRPITFAEEGLGEEAENRPRIPMWLAHVFGRGKAKPSVRAAAEAWIGTSFTYDGVTYSGGLLPGSPFENSPASLASPVKQRNYQAATDPWVTSAPCGRFHVAYVAFTRFQGSSVAIATYEDRNNQDGQHTIAYLYTTIVETAYNASFGPFHDLPYVVADPARNASADPCAYNLYVTWMTFQGIGGGSRANFAKSTDGGLTFKNRFIPTPAKTNQRAVIAVDPMPGTPTTTGGGTIWVGFRSFDPLVNAFWVSRSIDFGEKFERAVQLNGSPIVAFDQPVQSSTDHTPAELAFRTNGYMTLQAVPNPATGRSTLFAAWTERVNLITCATSPPGPSCGGPDPAGEPRLVVMKSVDPAGAVWTDLAGNAGQRKAIDFGDRDAAPQTTPAPGLGYLPQRRASGAQIQPHFTFGGDRFGLFYLEARGPLVGGFIAGIDRHLDARFALLDPATGGLLGTTQVSQYPVKAGANLTDGETADDIAEVLVGSSSKQINNKSNFPNSGGGRSPFIGDYIAATPTVQYVLDKTTKRWRWATQRGDLPFNGFHTLWADSRFLIPPSGTPEQQVAKSPQFQGVTLPACAADLAGSRDHDMMTALVDARVIVSAPTTFKQLGTIQRAFPVTIANGTGVARFFRATFDKPTIGSFDQLRDVDTLNVQLLPFSSTTPVVYVQSSNPTDSLTVNVTETQCPNLTPDQSCVPLADGLSGSVTLNLDPTNAAFQNNATGNTERHNPVVTSPVVTSPVVTSPVVTSNYRSPVVTSPVVTSPVVTSPVVTSPVVTSAVPSDWTGGVTDFTWTVNGTDDIVNSGTYAQVFLNDAAALVNDYALELRIYRLTSHTLVSNCTAVSVPDEQLISSIPNPVVTSPVVTSPFQNPVVTSPVVTSATFALAPADHHTGSYHDGTLHDQLHNQIFVTLRAYHRTANAAQQHPISVPAIAVQSQSFNVINGVIDTSAKPGAVLAPDLVVSGTPALTPGTSVAGGSVTVNWTLSNAGNAAAAAGDGSITHRYVYSANAILGDGDDVAIGTDTTTGAVAAAATQSFSKALIIPSSATPGSGFIFIVADGGSEVSESSETNNSASVAVTIVPGLAILNTDYARAGLGGLRGGTGSGTIALTLPSGATIRRALLYWHGPTNSTDPAINAAINFAGTAITGTNIGISGDNNWNFLNAQAYRADVTSLISAAQTSYAVSNLRKTTAGGIDADINGLSLLVFYDDGFAGNNQDVYLYDSNDSCCANTFDAGGWDVLMQGVNFQAGRIASLEMHVADGQDFAGVNPTPAQDDGAIRLNGSLLFSPGNTFQGTSVPTAGNTTVPSGRLWDIRSVSITSLLAPGLNTLRLTQPQAAAVPTPALENGFDCIAVIVGVVVVGNVTDVIGAVPVDLPVNGEVRLKADTTGMPLAPHR